MTTNNKQLKQDSHLTWLCRELIYDISSAGWLLYDTRQELDNHRRHQLADICKDENLNLVLRLLGEAFATVATAMTRVTRTGYHPANDSLRKKSRFRLRVKEEYLPLENSRRRYLVERVHRYMVVYVLWRYLARFIPEEASPWKSEAEEIEASLPSIANSIRASSGKTTIRRPLSPF